MGTPQVTGLWGEDGDVRVWLWGQGQATEKEEA